MLDDPKGMFRDVSDIGTSGKGEYEAVVNQETDLDYLMSMVRDIEMYPLIKIAW
jgi:predicted transport protein